MSGPVRRIVVGITGASGVVYGIRVLERLRTVDGIETHLVTTPAAKVTLGHESDRSPAEVEALADVVHGIRDIGAPIASGSFATAGMIVAPCSIKTLSAIANSYAADLLARAADVTLKERRPLVLMVRETPLHLGHLRSLAALAELGACILPPMIAMYVQPRTVDDLLNYILGKLLDQLGFPHSLHPRWREPD